MAALPTHAIAERYRVAQARTASGTAARVLVALRRLLQPARLTESFPGYALAAAEIVADGRAEAAAQARAFYLATRTAAGVRGPLPEVAPAPPIEPARLATSLLVTGPVTAKKALARGATVPQAMAAAESATAGAVYRHTANAGRETIRAAARSDAEAIGWARVTDGRPCWFCAMLASRGAVYESKRTATTTEDGDPYHDGCGCYPFPIFSRRDKVPGLGPELEKLWHETQRTKPRGVKPADAFREAYEKAYPPDVDPGETIAKAQGEASKPVYRLSDDAMKRVEEVAASLPKTEDEWLAPVRETVAPAGRRIDHRIAEAERELAAAQAALETARAELLAEFKRKRTPVYKRAEIERERLWQADADVNLARSQVESLRRMRDEGDLDPYLAEEVPAQYEYHYPTDPRGTKIPPSEYERHLDRVLALGRDLLAEARAAFEDDPVRKAARDYAATDPRESLQRVAKREQEIIRGLLASVRDMGGHAQRFERGTDDPGHALHSGWEERLREGETVYPTDWLKRADTNGGVLSVGGTDRAYYNGALERLALDDYDYTNYVGGFSTGQAEIAAHELGHRMEKHIPGLKALEFTFVRRRATQGGIVDTPVDMGGGEMTLQDHWADAYTGKTYEDPAFSSPAELPWELFQTGVQDTLGRSPLERFGDDDLQAFVLAALATLGR